jgi:hypothetical protein
LCEIDGIGEIFRCPATFVNGPVSRILDLYPHYKNSILPKSGGLLDQSATFIEAVGVIDGVIRRLQIEEAKGDG